jgi:anti-sigma regulatory factor (Ser/Thr protein kinase)
MTRKMSMVLENKLEELSVLTQMLQVFLRPYQMPSGALYALELSLEEILVNIISYAYDDDECHDIEFKVEVDEDMIAMTFMDGGHPFNPLAKEKTDTKNPLMERGVGGLGINFVRQMRDMMEYQRKGDKNILRLWFQRKTETA